MAGATRADANSTGGDGGHGRICLLTSSFPRWPRDATAPFLLDLAQDVRACGWTVEVLAPHAVGAAPREVLAGVPVTRFRYAWPAAQQTVCYRGGALFNLRREPSNWLKLPALVLCQGLALLRAHFRRRFAVLHAHWILPQGLVAVAVGALCRTPVVITVHGSDVFALHARPWRWAKRVALRGAAAVTVNSAATEAAVREIAPGLRTVHRVPMGVAMVPAEERPRVPPSAAGPLLAFAGRLVAQKGVDDLLRAVAILGAERPHVGAIVLGDGPERAHLEALAQRLRIAGRVRFLGWVEPARVASYLAAADIFVLPAKATPDGGAEGQGLAVIEAMLAGTPVIASRSGGLVDAVRHEQTGLLVEEAAPAQIAAAVVRLLDDPALADRLAREAKALAATTYSRSGTAAAFAKIFAAVTAGDPGRGQSA
jgi:glycosyltransferase involved in cell wall biosynthesis